MSATLERGMIERLVRQAIEKRGFAPMPSIKTEPKLVVNVSARHCHVTAGRPRTAVRQGTQADADEDPLPGRLLRGRGGGVTIIGPRQRMITQLRILGPCRDHTQVELAFTDAISLGLDIPVRKRRRHQEFAGRLADGPGRHDPDGERRHPTRTARAHGAGGLRTLRRQGWGSTASAGEEAICGGLLENLLVRFSPASKLEVHIDTDEGNAVNLGKATRCEFIPLAIGYWPLAIGQSGRRGDARLPQAGRLAKGSRTRARRLSRNARLRENGDVRPAKPECGVRRSWSRRYRGRNAIGDLDDEYRRLLLMSLGSASEMEYLLLLSKDPRLSGREGVTRS